MNWGHEGNVSFHVAVKAMFGQVAPSPRPPPPPTPTGREDSFCPLHVLQGNLRLCLKNTCKSDADMLTYRVGLSKHAASLFDNILAFPHLLGGKKKRHTCIYLNWCNIHTSLMISSRKINLRRSKKKKTCLASPPASFFEAACFFFGKNCLKKYLKNNRFQFFFFFFFFFQRKRSHVI